MLKNEVYKGFSTLYKNGGNTVALSGMPCYPLLYNSINLAILLKLLKEKDIYVEAYVTVNDYVRKWYSSNFSGSLISVGDSDLF
jgi:hypothetical protein